MGFLGYVLLMTVGAVLAVLAWLTWRLGFLQRIPLVLRAHLSMERILPLAARMHGDRTIIELEEPLQWDGRHEDGTRLDPLRWSARRIDLTVADLAALLRDQLDVGINERVAILKRNHFDIFLFGAAAIRAGAIGVPINGGMATNAVPAYLDRVGAAVLITDVATITRVLSEGGNFGTVRCILVADEAPPPGVMHELMARLKKLRGPRRVVWIRDALVGVARPMEPVARGKDDPIYIVHTSGTTGFPKGVIVQNRGMLQSLRATLTFNPISRRDLAYFALPLNHQVVQLYLHTVLLLGAKTVISSDFHPARALETIGANGITIFFGFPISYTKLLGEDLTKANLRSMRIWGTTADASHEVHQRSLVRYGRFLRDLGIPRDGSVFVDGLGSSEVGIAALLRIAGPWTQKFGRRVGHPVPFGPKVKVTDVSGRPTKNGEPGRLMIKGKSMFGGYWNDHGRFYEATGDGWWFTGDIVRREKDGCFVHLDREVDVVRPGKAGCYTLPIEEQILKHPGVYDACVFGIKDANGKPVPAAVVACRNGVGTQKNDELLRMELNKELQEGDKLAYLRILPWEEFPIGLTGKTLKRVLRQNFQEMFSDNRQASR